MASVTLAKGLRTVDFKKYIDLVQAAIREVNREFAIGEEIGDEQIAGYEDRMLMRLKAISRQFYLELMGRDDDAAEEDEDINLRLMLSMAAVSAAWSAYVLKVKSKRNLKESALMGEMAEGMGDYFRELSRQAVEYGSAKA